MRSSVKTPPAVRNTRLPSLPAVTFTTTMTATRIAVPSTLHADTELVAISERQDARDCAVFHTRHHGKITTLAQLPANSVVGTSSARRRAFLSRAYPTLRFKDVRGNVKTRLRKLDDDANGYGDDHNGKVDDDENNHDDWDDSDDADSNSNGDGNGDGDGSGGGNDGDKQR